MRMRNKIVMKQESKPALTPKLRFPEFRDAEGWTEKPLGEVSDILMCKRIFAEETNPNKGVPFFKIGTLGGVPDAFISGEKFEDYKSRYNFPRKSEVLITCSGTVGKCLPYDGKDAYFQDSNIVWIDNPTLEVSNEFLLMLLSDVNWGRLNSTTITRIYGPDLRGLAIRFPEDKHEQQKIADCLTSLDELITAQSQKLDALKTHKKGLMQQLFPREGETIPRLRFPEFQDVRGWAKKPFSALCEIKHGYAFEGEFFSDAGEYVLLTPGSFYEEGGYRDRGDKQKYYTGEIPQDYVLKEGDMLVAMTEQAAGLLGSPLLVPESDKFLHNQRLGLVVPKPDAPWTNEFFFHVFNSQSVRKAIHASAAGAKVRHTSPIKIGEVVVTVPASLPEQQRIATCLTALDDLITAHSAKLSALKTHKKGLMQQLFPSPEEVEA